MYGVTGIGRGAQKVLSGPSYLNSLRPATKIGIAGREGGGLLIVKPRLIQLNFVSMCTIQRGMFIIPPQKKILQESGARVKIIQSHNPTLNPPFSENALRT